MTRKFPNHIQTEFESYMRAAYGVRPMKATVREQLRCAFFGGAATLVKMLKENETTDITKIVDVGRELYVFLEEFERGVVPLEERTDQ
jgi:hypothetical protein